MKNIFNWLLVLLISITTVGCASLPSKQVTKVKVEVEQAPIQQKEVIYTQTGKASYYATRHQAAKTASGERYKHELNTAAHRSLPFGSIVRVTNVANNKSVLVKINDRGPYLKSRVVDLSKSAFTSIASLSTGVINVKVELVAKS
jgi:rare lipoprotein A